MKGETGDVTVVKTIDGEGAFILPKKCRYFSADIGDLERSLGNHKFDLILMDPPWENKHISRLKRRKNETGYNTLLNQNVFDQIPIETMLETDGILVTWCTNSARHLDDLKSAIKRWNLSVSAEWLWLKVTQSGETVSPLESSHSKLPYERLILAQSKPTISHTDGHVIVSVPSAIHSHKPPLDRILNSLGLNCNRKLEIFGRYLLPDWTTFGNQALQLQHESYFDKL